MKTIFALAALVLAAPSLAADPSDLISQPVPEAMPFPLSYGAPILLKESREVLKAALGEAEKHGWRMACAVVEPTGDLVTFAKMDDTQYASGEVAIVKAKAAARYRRSTKAFADAVKAGAIGLIGYPGVIAGEGGFPILKGGKIIGAIGCSGSASNQDATAALAGVQEIK